jgi:quinol monooxygenase YgiN
MLPDAGPVMVTVEYFVRPENGGKFATAITELGTVRRRDGAYAWGVFQDTDIPERWLEYFLVESWVQHLRQHERVSHADEALQRALLALHVGPEPPRVSHLIAPGNALPPAIADARIA